MLWPLLATLYVIAMTAWAVSLLHRWLKTQGPDNRDLIAPEIIERIRARARSLRRR